MQKTFHVEQRHQALLYEPPLHQEQAGVVGAGTPCTKSETQQKLRVGVSAKVKRVCGSQGDLRKSRGSAEVKGVCGSQGVQRNTVFRWDIETQHKV